MTLKIHEDTNVAFGSRRYLFKTNLTQDRTERMRQLGHYRYVPKPTRRYILQRDNYTCQLCGQYGDQVDHIIPWRISHDNSPENLRTLCRQCNTATRLQRRDSRLSFEDYCKCIEAELEKLSKRELVTV